MHKTYNYNKPIVKPGRGRLIATGSLLPLAVGAAFAQTANGGNEGVDFTATLTTFKDTIGSFYATNGPLFMGILAGAIIFGLAVTWVRKLVRPKGGG